MNEQVIIPEEKARARADTYLKERHFKYEKVVFQDVELIDRDGQIIYRFKGLLIEKPSSLIDMLARDRKSSTYKFIVDVNAKNGRVLSYQLT